MMLNIWLLVAISVAMIPAEQPKGNNNLCACLRFWTWRLEAVISKITGQHTSLWNNLYARSAQKQNHWLHCSDIISDTKIVQCLTSAYFSERNSILKTATLKISQQIAKKQVTVHYDIDAHRCVHRCANLSEETWTINM